jgi:hypothetical protein
LKIRHLEVCLQATSETFRASKKIYISFEIFRSNFDGGTRKKKGSLTEPLGMKSIASINHQTFSV